MNIHKDDMTQQELRHEIKVCYERALALSLLPDAESRYRDLIENYINWCAEYEEHYRKKFFKTVVSFQDVEVVESKLRQWKEKKARA